VLSFNHPGSRPHRFGCGHHFSGGIVMLQGLKVANTGNPSAPTIGTTVQVS
jgi:hypothetical protein